MTSNRDLRTFQKDGAIDDAFSKLVSGGKAGFKTVIEKKEPILCPNESCKIELEGHEKFCPKCGMKIEKKTGPSICTKCYTVIHQGSKFCTNCGGQVI